MKLKLVAAMASLMLVSGCVRYTHPQGTQFCGVHLPTGAVVIRPATLDPRAPAPGPAPATSTLPPQLPGDLANSPQLSLVRTSSGCDRGAVVTVTPADGAYLYATVPAKHDGLAGIALARISRPVTVSSWVGGRYQGSLVLPPPGQ